MPSRYCDVLRLTEPRSVVVGTARCAVQRRVQGRNPWVNEGRSPLVPPALRAGTSQRDVRYLELATGNRVAARAALRGLPAGQEQGRVSILNQCDARSELLWS